MTTGTLPTFRPGQQWNELSSAELQRMAEEVRRLGRISGSGGIRVVSDKGGIAIIGAKDRVGGGDTTINSSATVQLFRLDSINPTTRTTMSAKPYDTFTGTVGTAVTIALPLELRGTTGAGSVGRHGVTLHTFQYSTSVQQCGATAGGVSETWVVTPPYYQNAFIWATKPAGGVGFNATPAVEWQDLNVDGRAWAKKFGT